MTNTSKSSINIIGYYTFAILLIFIASIRPLGFDKDLIGYYEIMNYIINNNNFLIEPAFVHIVKLSYSYLGEETYQRCVIIIFAFLHISILAYAFWKLSKHPFYSLLLYSLLFYPTLGLTQMRYSIAISLFLLSINDIIKRNSISFYLKIFTAFLFHYSAAMFLFFYFLNSNYFNKKKYLMLLFLSLSIPFMTFFIMKGVLYLYDLHILPDYVMAKIYSNFILHSDKLNFTVFNIFLIAIVSFYVHVLVIFEKYKNIKNNLNIVLLKILGIGILLYMFFSISPVISFRILNGMMIVFILLLSNILSIYRQSNFVLIIFTIIAIFLFFNTTIRNELLNWSILF